MLEAGRARTRGRRHVLVVGDGINEIDASGEEVIRHLVQRLRENGDHRGRSAGSRRQVLQRDGATPGSTR